MSEGVSESRFYMWRAVVAMVHADGVVTPHEVSFLNDYIHDINLSKEQMETIGLDLQTPQDVYEMFLNISDRNDKKDFFSLARALSWCDGDFDAQEQHIIEQLEKQQLSADNIALLEESREILNEVELCRNQWKNKSEQGQDLFGFLKKAKTA